jgi:hypothetical protein
VESQDGSIPWTAPTKKSRKTPRQIAEEKVARNRQRKQARGTGEPVDRFNLSTNEKDAKTPVIKTTKATKIPLKVSAAVGSGEDSQGSFTDASAKKTHTSHESRSASKPKPCEMTAEELALLAGITQAGREEQDQYVQANAESEKRDTSFKSTAHEEEELRTEVAAIERAQHTGKTTKLSKPEEKRQSPAPATPKSSKKRKTATADPSAASSSLQEGSTPATSPASTSSKKRKLPLEGSDSETSSPIFSPSARLTKKAKKVSFSEGIVSPVERSRKISIRHVMDTEDDEVVGQVEKKAEAEDAAMSGNEDGEQMMENNGAEVEGSDDELDDLFGE